MKISVKIDNVEIIIDEIAHDTTKIASLKWADETKNILEVLKVMTNEAERLYRFIPNPIPVSAHGQPGDGK